MFILHTHPYLAEERGPRRIHNIRAALCNLFLFSNQNQTPSGLCIFHLDRMVGSFPNLHESELWMTNTVDHVVCEWHLNMRQVMWSHISFWMNISRSWNSLIEPSAPSSYCWGSSDGVHKRTLWLLTKTRISCLWFPVISKLFPFCPVTCKPKSPRWKKGPIPWLLP